MNILEFTNQFLPQLVLQYTQHDVDLKALVDFDLWEQLFPTPDGDARTDEIIWRQIKLNAFQLQDGSLLLTYDLPNPTQTKMPKFIGIRIDRNTRDAKFYTLLRARFYDEPWEIQSIDFTHVNQSGKHQFKFLRMIEGTWSLRNFVLSVQQTPLIDSKESIFSMAIKAIRNGSIIQQEG